MLFEAQTPDHLENSENLQNGSEAPKKRDPNLIIKNPSENWNPTKPKDNKAMVESANLEYTNINSQPLEYKQSHNPFSSSIDEELEKPKVRKDEQVHHTTVLNPNLSPSEFKVAPLNSTSSAKLIQSPVVNYNSSEIWGKGTESKSNQFSENENTREPLPRQPLEISKNSQDEKFSPITLSDESSDYQSSVSQSYQSASFAPHLQLPHNIHPNKNSSTSISVKSDSPQSNASSTIKKTHDIRLNPNSSKLSPKMAFNGHNQDRESYSKSSTHVSEKQKFLQNDTNLHVSDSHRATMSSTAPTPLLSTSDSHRHMHNREPLNSEGNAAVESASETNHYMPTANSYRSVNDTWQVNNTPMEQSTEQSHFMPAPDSHSPASDIRPLNSGSHTVVEIPQNINQALSQANSLRGENYTVPILRLSVDPLTHDVEYNSKFDKEGISPNSQSSWNQRKKSQLKPHARKNNFILKLSEPTVVIHHFEDYIEEINDSNTSASTGGEKRDIKGNWKENWLQQKKHFEDESGNIQEHTFGEKSGHDIARHQRWTERWNNRGSQIEVERNVLRYDDDNNQIIEEWNENLTRDELTNFVLIDKYGTDRTDETTRNWKSIYQEERDPEKPSVLVIEEYFQEQKGDIRKGKSCRKENGVIIHSKEWLHDASKNGESWSDETFANTTGYTWGQKSGNKTNGQRWAEKWFKTDEGDCETDRWVQEPTLKTFSGEKSGFCTKTGEEYNEKWKKSDSKEEKYIFTDRWWARPLEKRRWGIKNETNEHFKTTGGCSNPQLVSKEDYTEDWHDNEEEFAKNECKISTEYQTLQNGHTETVETKVYKKGNRHGNHYITSQEWNDEWTELYESDNVEDKDTTVTHKPKPVLKLKLKSYDKWWKENNSNCWGEKRFDDFTTDQLREEKWYFNPSGWQVDKWEKCSDGSWIGEKHGSKNDGTSWNEAWKRDDNLGSEWIEKSWNELKDDKIYKWGETTERAEIANSRSHWTEVRNLRNFQGDFSSEKFNDDGFGNIKTEKEGRVWREESGKEQVINWYYDSYGENLGRSEKWAFKKGYNDGGSEWVEKWNEMPSQKYSTKAGKNGAGDEWSETWQEVMEDSVPVMKWAEKQGKNANGDEWMEKWAEEKQNKKTAIKRGSNIKGEKWEERWGEDIRTDGSGEKWTSKWAKESDGTTHGNSWGDRWAPNEHHSGHHWGEEWTNDDVRKWWHDTSGRPEGC